jgi:hypothetical protein
MKEISMSDNTTPAAQVRSTSVSITLNAKSLGVDAFVKFEETIEFPELVDAVEALMKREEMSALIADQLIAVIKDLAATVKTAAPALPAGPVVPQALAGTYQGQPAPAGAGAAAIHAVANGATAGGMDWRNAPDRFDAGKTVRYLSSDSYPAEAMKAAAAAWLASAGFNPEAFDIWDERRDAEAGKAISSVCNIKVKKELHSLVPRDVVATNTGGVKAVARAKFNHDGSMFFYWSKDAEAAAKYGALDNLKGPITSTTTEEEAF